MEEKREVLLAKSNQMREKALRIVKDTKLLEIWQGIGAEINQVGSLAMDLMMKHRDIDFHIYTDPFKLSDSFKAIARLAEYPRIRSISYTNLFDEEDKCVEWHATYLDEDGEEWVIDMIHILKDSEFTGYFERVAQKISENLTEDTRAFILEIKNSIPEEKKVMGIRIYRAAIEGGVRDLDGFYKWEQEHPVDGKELWMPARIL